MNSINKLRLENGDWRNKFIRHSGRPQNLSRSLRKVSTLKSQLSSQKGFSLAELVVIIAITIIMLGLGTVSLLNSQQKASLSTVVDTFIADIKEQQVKAMVGDTEGTGSASDYGIDFETTQYTLFRDTYVAGNNQNFSVALPPSIQVTSPRITFAKGSGETTPVSITFTDTTTNEVRTVTINKYGAVVGVN